MTVAANSTSFRLEDDLQPAAAIVRRVVDGGGKALHNGGSQAVVVRLVQRITGGRRCLHYDLHASALLGMRNGQIHDSMRQAFTVKQEQFLHKEDKIIAAVSGQALPLAELFDFRHQSVNVEIDGRD